MIMLLDHLHLRRPFARWMSDDNDDKLFLHQIDVCTSTNAAGHRVTTIRSINLNDSFLLLTRIRGRERRESSASIHSLIANLRLKEKYVMLEEEISFFFRQWLSFLYNIYLCVSLAMITQSVVVVLFMFSWPRSERSLSRIRGWRRRHEMNIIWTYRRCTVHIWGQVGRNLEACTFVYHAPSINCEKSSSFFMYFIYRLSRP